MARTASKAPRSSKVEEVKKAEVIETVKSLTPKTVAAQVAELQSSISIELGQISGKLTQQLEVSRTLDQAIQLKHEQLKSLHGLEVTADTGNVLKDEIESTRSEWSREEDERAQRWQEEEQEHAKEQSRKNDEYNYQFAKTKRSKEDELTTLLDTRKKAFDTDQETRIKLLAERSALVNAAEQELKEHRVRVANIPTEIDKAVKAEVARATNAQKSGYDNERTILLKDKEHLEALAGQRVAAANAEVVKLQAQLAASNATIAQLHEDVKAISTNAFSAVSGQAALKAVQDVQRAETPAGRQTR